MFRRHKKNIDIFLVHPGGPFWKNKDEGAWSIPKGEYEASEDPLKAAIREFEEETGSVPAGDFLPLSAIRLKSGKQINAWAVEGEIDPETIVSNLISIDWPPKSGKKLEIPEVDKAGWFSIAEGMKKINPAQASFIRELEEHLV